MKAQNKANLNDNKISVSTPSSNVLSLFELFNIFCREDLIWLGVIHLDYDLSKKIKYYHK